MKNSVVKIIALVSVLGIVFSAMYGCGKKNAAEQTAQISEQETVASEADTKAEQTTETPVTEEVTSAAEKESSQNTDKKIRGWVDACKTYLEKYIAGPDYTGEELFSLHYIDSDDIPELVISHGTHFYQSASVYVFNEASDDEHADRYVKVPNDFGTTGMFFYKEKSGIIVSANAKMGYRHTDVYNLDGNFAKEVFSSIALYPEYKMEDETESYQISDKSVSREEYEKQYNNFVPKNLCMVSIEEFNKNEIKGDGYLFAKDITYHETTPSYALTAENIAKYVK